MSNPLVSIIVLSYNHSPYVEEAVSSILIQDYKNIEIIGIDDCSTDGSGEILSMLGKKNGFRVFRNSTNMGNCKSFNTALSRTRGKYIIDLAADDLLMPGRISTGVEVLENLPDNYGVHFCDAELIDGKGRFIKTHYRRDSQGALVEDVPQGFIFKELVEKYLICTPTMMIKKNVLDDLGGYDESLSYEDFDFWVRSSKRYRYAFSDKALVKKRVLKASHSTRQKKILNRQIKSTALVCKKALALCETQEELKALLKRINYEMKWAIATGNFAEVVEFYRLRAKIKSQAGQSM